MSGRILVVDDVATNRIVLKVKLSASQYDILQCADFAEAETCLERSTPDMIVIDQSVCDWASVAFCKFVRSDPGRASLPILILAAVCTTEVKNGLLSIGVDEVLIKPINETLLLARIRSLLRAKSATAELSLRDDTKRALGLAESKAPFVKPSLVGILSKDPKIANRWAEALIGQKGLFCSILDSQRVFSAQSTARAPDVYLIEGCRAESAVTLRLLSEIRSRPETRLASILLVVPDNDPELAAMALDLGADDLLFEGFSDQELTIRLTSQVERKRHQDRLRSDLRDGIAAAVTDPLTGLYNRRYALPHLERLAERSRRSKRQLAVMVVDVDHFKSVNDTFGHEIGDLVLQEVAERLKSNLRSVDLIARIGGEEFLVVLPDVDKDQAAAAAERLRKSVNAEPFILENRSTVVTVSIGMALSSLEESQTEPTELIRRADEALYHSKSSGRNMVSIAQAAAA